MTLLELQQALPAGYAAYDPNPEDADIEFDILRGDILVARVGCWDGDGVSVRRLTNGHLESGTRCAETPEAIVATLLELVV